MYKTEKLSLKICDKTYNINQVTNVDEVFDHLIHTAKDDVNVSDERIPYWTEIWPSALALSEFIIKNHGLFEEKNIIEIGSGLALPSIVASEFAKEVVITDYLEDAINFAKANVLLNERMNVNFSKLDWRNNSTEIKYDVVLASDIAYEKRSFEFIPKAIETLLKDDGVCYISEPGRAMAKEFFETLMPSFFNCEKVASYDVDWRGVGTKVGIYRIG